jgi:hypothetical protein
MSQIAEFRIVPASKLPALVNAGGFEDARLLAPFPFSGDVLLTLSMLGDFLLGSLKAEAAKLAESRGNSVVLFDVAAAQRELAQPVPTREQIDAFLTDEYGDPEGAELIEGGIAHCRGWLQELNDGEIGLLSIG